MPCKRKRERKVTSLHHHHIDTLQVKKSNGGGGAKLKMKKEDKVDWHAFAKVGTAGTSEQMKKALRNAKNFTVDVACRHITTIKRREKGSCCDLAEFAKLNIFRQTF